MASGEKMIAGCELQTDENYYHLFQISSHYAACAYYLGLCISALGCLEKEKITKAVESTEKTKIVNCLRRMN